jgi:hypothetical protein
MERPIERSAPERIADHAKAAGAGAKRKVDETLRAAQAKTGDFQAVLADTLETGAESLRGKGHQLVPSVRRSPARRSKRAWGAAAHAAETVAGGMDRIAIWLRENELAEPVSMLERQWRTRPARTALIAIGIGFILGRRFRHRAR